LRTESGLRSAVIVSLFTDRRAAPGDEIPDGSNDRRGSWHDNFLDDENDLQGSRLWLLSREKELPQVLIRAREYAEEALKWLVDDGVAEHITVLASHVRAGVIGLHIVIRLLESSEIYEDVFDYSYNKEAA